MYSAEFESIKDSCTMCKKCVLHEDRLNIVFGEGSENADILFAGDFPRGKDDLKGMPFTGKEGDIFRKFLTLCDIDKDKIFVTNILKCRPEDAQIPDGVHYDACMEHLRNQVRFIKPKIIVCLGKAVAKKMIDPAFDLDRNHGQLVKKGKLFFLATYHPSELRDNEYKKTCFLGDLQSMRESAKQGGLL